MKLARAILELRYQQIPDVFSHKRKVLEALGADIPDDFSSFTENVDIKAEEQFAHITVTAHNLLITIERTTEKRASTFMLAAINKLQPLLRLKDVDQVGVRCIYYSETDLPFKEVVQVYKQNFFKDMPLIADATDVGVPLTFKIEDYRANFSTGPMQSDQFKSLLEFGELELQNVHYLDLDFIRYNVSFSEDFINSNLSNVFKHHKTIIATVEKAVIYE